MFFLNNRLLNHDQTVTIIIIKGIIEKTKLEAELEETLRNTKSINTVKSALPLFVIHNDNFYIAKSALKTPASY